MYFFTLASVDRFAEAISVLNRLTESAILVVSSDMASITIYHHSLHSIVSFQMMPPFFTCFFSSHSHHSRISLPRFNDLLSTITQPSLFTSLALYVTDPPDCIRLQFRNPCPKDHENIFLNRQLTMENMPLESPFSLIDMTTFVSIHSQDFKRVITMFNGYEGLLVSLTNSRVMFSAGSKKIIFTKKERKCIIGGTIPKKKEVYFMVTIYPLYFYQNIAVRSERVWFFLNSDYKTMMIAPTGLFDQYMILFPY